MTARGAKAEHSFAAAVARQQGGPYDKAQTVVGQNHAQNEAQTRIKQTMAMKALRTTAIGKSYTGLSEVNSLLRQMCKQSPRARPQAFSFQWSSFPFLRFITFRPPTVLMR